MTRITSDKLLTLAVFTLIIVSTVMPAHAQTFSTLYAFGTRSEDAVDPQGMIAQGRDGALYSTAGGGANNYGSIFKVTPAGKEAVIYSFCSATNCSDGTGPSGLSLRPDGHFLGTTAYSGTNYAPGGTVFDVTQTGSLTTLHTFTGGADGEGPVGPPILGPDGSYYGVTTGGGNFTGCGTIYKITGTAFSVVHNFDKTHGCNPVGPLLLGTDGNLYGVALAGGTSKDGVIFQFEVPAGKAPVLNILANLGATTTPPNAPLVEGNDGNFYGTTVGASQGTIFQITPSGTFTVLHALAGSDGMNPEAGLVLASDGNFYGIALNGGQYGSGTLFQATSTGGFSVLYNFGAEGEGFLINSSPVTAPFQSTNGLLYGDTTAGGGGACEAPGCGTFYSWSDSLPTFVSTVQTMGAVGSTVDILGQGFTSATTVSFNGVAATATIQSANSLSTTVPAGASTGTITVSTSGTTLSTIKPFVVTP